MELKLLKRIHHVTFLQRRESPVSTLPSAAASTTETGQDPLRDACRYSTLFGIFGAACRYSALYGIFGAACRYRTLYGIYGTVYERQVLSKTNSTFYDRPASQGQSLN